MKNIRKFSRNPLTIIIVTFSFLFVSCELNQVGIDNENSKINSFKTEHSGEEIFRELLLLESGRISTKIPEYGSYLNLLENMSDKQKQERRKLNNEIIESIKTTSPGYFENFKASMISGDVYLINDELRNAGKVVSAALGLSESYNDNFELAREILEENDVDLSDIASVEGFLADVKINGNNKMTNQRTKQEACLAVAVAMVIVVIGVLAVAAVWVWVAVDSQSPSDWDNNTSKLKRELISLSISEVL